MIEQGGSRLTRPCRSNQRTKLGFGARQGALGGVFVFVEEDVKQDGAGGVRGGAGGVDSGAGGVRGERP